MNDIFEVIKSGNFLILDTETTGLGSDAEICQLAIIDAQGNTLLDTLVKPVKPIPPEATAIHGITNEMVKDAKQFQIKSICDVLATRNVIVYNAAYDVRMLQQSGQLVSDEQNMSTDWFVISKWHCAMEAFAAIYGDWNDHFKSYRWKSLSVACNFYKIPVSKDVHSALADAKMTLEVCKAMVEHEVIE